MRFHSPVGTAGCSQGREPLEIEKPRSAKPPEGATGKARCNFVPDQPRIWAPAIMRFLSPLTGLCLVGACIFQGLTPLATPFRPLRGLPRRDGKSSFNANEPGDRNNNLGFRVCLAAARTTAP